MKYHIITYGCQMNRSDSERIVSVLESIGYKPASKENEADLIVVNMCSVRQSAVDRVYGKIRDFTKLKACPVGNQRLSPGVKNDPETKSKFSNGARKLKVILTGCILKKDREKLKEGYDLILDIKDLENWQKYLSPIFYGRRKQRTVKGSGNYLEILPKHQSNFSVFVPISRGCNNCCSYCAVPFTRGKLICRPHKEILKEVKNAIKNGAKEIWLLGQNVNAYFSNYPRIKSNKTRIFEKNSSSFESNSRGSINFAKLLKMVNDIPGNFWIRFISPHPNDFSDELIETMTRCEKVCEYIHLPIQSGDDEILKKMNRSCTADYYLNLIKKIRETFVNIRKKFGRELAISTDIIVGFPGETRKQFENTAKIMRKVKFDMAYIAEYSPRSGTAAAKLKDDVSIAEKKRRQKVLNDILKKTALEKNKNLVFDKNLDSRSARIKNLVFDKNLDSRSARIKKFVGKTVEVLIEKTDKDFIYGKTRTFKNVKIKNSPVSPFEKGGLRGISSLPGQFLKVKITKADIWGLEGEII